MSVYKAIITKNSEGSFHALVVRVDEDGRNNVINHYPGNHFKTEKGAIRSTSNYISKYCN